MRTVSVSQRSRTVSRLLDIARKETLVLRTASGEEFVLAAVDEFDHELTLQRANKSLMEFLEGRFRQARSAKGIRLGEAVRRYAVDPHEKNPRRKTGKHPR